MLVSSYHSEKKAAEAERGRMEEELASAEHLLSSYTENLRQKNQLIVQFKADLEQLETQLKGKQDNQTTAVYLEKLQEAVILTEENWVEFRRLFDKVHPGFIFRLKEKYVQVTESDVRLLTLMKLQLSPTEMAAMLGVSHEAIRKAKQRLRKRIDLPAEKELNELVASI